MAATHPLYEKLGAVITRASEDSDFEQQLKSDPKGTLQAQGVPVADDANITVVDGEPESAPPADPPADAQLKGDVTLYIPDKSDSELSDRELEGVSGGSGISFCFGGGCTSACVYIPTCW